MPGLLSGPPRVARRGWSRRRHSWGARPATPRSVPLRWACPQPYLTGGSGVPGSPPGCCHEQNSKPCNVCVSPHVLDTTFLRNSTWGFKHAAIFYFTFARSSCRVCMRVVCPPRRTCALGATSAGLSGQRGPSVLTEARRERGSAHGRPGKDSFSSRLSVSVLTAPHRHVPNGPRGAQTAPPSSRAALPAPQGGPWAPLPLRCP